jgi:hypothetical protein
MMQEGRWVGEVRLQHFATGAAIPFLVDWFRIDDPRSVQPMNIAAVCRDLTTQKRSEAELRHLNETLEQRVAARTRELADANLKLVAESIEREDAWMPGCRSFSWNSTTLPVSARRGRWRRPWLTNSISL